NPGLVLPGVVRTICLLIALYALHLLPVNYAGLALMVLGIGFMIAEAFFPAYGSLGIGGLIAFVLGSILLIDSDFPGFSIPYTLIAGLAAASRAILILALCLLVRRRRVPVGTGRAQMVGAAASIKILREYERAVVFLLGRFQAVKGPGLIIIIPVIQQMVRVDLRTVVLDVPPQDVITRDNVSVKVNAVVYFRVVDAQHAIIQ